MVNLVAPRISPQTPRVDFVAPMSNHLALRIYLLASFISLFAPKLDNYTKSLKQPE